MHGRTREYGDLGLLAQDTNQWRDLVKWVMNLRAPYKAENFLSSLAISSFSKTTLLHGISYVI